MHILPIHFTSYVSPYDINIRDTMSEKEKTTLKDHIFVSSSAESTLIFIFSLAPTHPRESLPPLSTDPLIQQVYTHLSQLLQNQPIWDKRYLLLTLIQVFL